MKRRDVAIAAAVSFAAVACGGGFAAGKKWNPSVEASIFDDGADIFDDPTKLSGKSENSARQALEVRADLADTTAVVNVVSIQSADEIDGTAARRIGVEVVERLYGDVPGRSFTLESAEAALGNAVIRRLEARLTGAFVVFIRWFDREDGSIGHHFHLSPSSPAVMEIVRPRAVARGEEKNPASKKK
jgi:hypothetical protein